MTPFDAAIELIVAIYKTPEWAYDGCHFGFNGWTCPKIMGSHLGCDECDIGKCLRLYCEWRAKEGSHD